MHFNTAEKNELTPVFEFYQPNLWESGNRGFLASYFGSVRKILFSPTEFFMSGSAKRQWLMPMLFALFSEITGLLFNMLYSVNDYGVVFHYTGDLSSYQLFVLSPLVFTLSYLILIPILHLGVFVLGGKGGLYSTYRVFAYSSAASLFYCIPYAGSTLSFLFRIMILLKGYRTLHGFSVLRGISALILPWVLLGILLAFVVLIPFALLGAGMLKNLFEFLSITG